MATEYGTRLRAARKFAGLTQQELSKKTGIPQSTISTAERIGSGSVETVTYAKACGVDANWLANGEGVMQRAKTSALTPINLENNPDYPPVRRVKFKLSAGASGFGVEYDDEEGAPIVFQRQWYEGRGLRPEKLFAVKVANGSMEPGLHHDDTVVVNTESTEPKDGTVFAVNYEGELVIKRLVRDSGQWWLSSDNANQQRYPRKMCDEHCVLIGEIVHKQSERI